MAVYLLQHLPHNLLLQQERQRQTLRLDVHEYHSKDMVGL